MSKPSPGARIWRVENTFQADADIKKIVRFILNREGPDRAQDILDKFKAAKESLQTLPGRGRIPPEMAKINVFTYREHQIPPYRMIYEISEPASLVSVHMVVDGRRDLPAIMASRLLQSASDPEKI